MEVSERMCVCGGNEETKRKSRERSERESREKDRECRERVERG